MVDLLALLAGGALGVLLGLAVLGIRRGSRPLPVVPDRASRPAAGPVATAPPRAAADYPIHVNRPASAATPPPPPAPAASPAAEPVVARLEPSGGKVVTLGSEPVTIGRGADQRLQVTDKRASRAHAVVRPRAKGGWELADAGSANGTLLNGHRIPDGRVAPLRDGDRIGIGGTTIAYHEDRGPAPTVRRPPSDPDATRIA